jgi:hypothetical protein
MSTDSVSFDEYFAEAPSPGNSGFLEAVHLSSTPAQVVLFTRDGASANIHFVTGGGYVHCNADRDGRCLACEAGLAIEKRMLLPVYDLTASAVKVLRIPKSFEPHSLFAHLKLRLNAADATGKVCEITRSGNRYQVRDLPAAPEADLGAEHIKSFLERMEKQEVSLRDCITSYSNRELADIPEVVTRATHRGINVNDWLAQSSAHGAS